jgi:phage tail-like protein
MPDPITGFHFLAVFEMVPQNKIDIEFQNISGLKASIEYEEIAEGGQNRFKHSLPLRSKFENLVMKRGLTSDLSGLRTWCNLAIDNFIFNPVNISIMLLNENHIPVKCWFIAHALPVSYELGELNAEESKIVIETITLKYNFLKEIPVP